MLRYLVSHEGRVVAAVPIAAAQSVYRYAATCLRRPPPNQPRTAPSSHGALKSMNSFLTALWSGRRRDAGATLVAGQRATSGSMEQPACTVASAAHVIGHQRRLPRIDERVQQRGPWRMQQ